MSSSRTERPRGRRDDAPDGRVGGRGHGRGLAGRGRRSRSRPTQTICEISTDKIDTEVPAPATGVVAEILVPVEATVTVGTVLARIADRGRVATAAASAAGESGSPPSAAERAGRRTGATAAPRRRRPRRRRGARPRPALLPGRAADRRRARHRPRAVTGTGRGGRVRKQDVLALSSNATARRPEPPLHIESPYRPDPVPAGRRAGPAPAPAARAGRGAGQLSRMRRQIGEHMKRSLETAAHVHDLDRGRHEPGRGGPGRRCGVTALPFVARACDRRAARAPGAERLARGRHATPATRRCNLGIAVSLGEDGLIVPVIHDAHELSVEGLRRADQGPGPPRPRAAS